MFWKKSGWERHGEGSPSLFGTQEAQVQISLSLNLFLQFYYTSHFTSQFPFVLEEYVYVCIQNWLSCQSIIQYFPNSMFNQSLLFIVRKLTQNMYYLVYK